MAGRFGAVTALALMLVATPAGARPTVAQKCEASKNLAAGKYALCRQKAEKTLVLIGDTTKYGDAITTCDSKLGTAW